MPPDKAVAPNMCVNIKPTGAIMSHDARIKGDISVLTDMDAFRECQIKLGAERQFNGSVNVHAQKFDKRLPTQTGENLA